VVTSVEQLNKFDIKYICYEQKDRHLYVGPDLFTFSVYQPRSAGERAIILHTAIAHPDAIAAYIYNVQRLSNPARFDLTPFNLSTGEVFHAVVSRYPRTVPLSYLICTTGSLSVD
jgi:hypothetical protein